MKKLLLTIAIFLSVLPGYAQEWSIRYVGDHPSGSIHFCDGIIDEEGVVFLVGREGPDREHPEAVFMRVEANGDHTENKYHKTGCFSQATCMVELPNHNLFVAGNLSDSLDDYLMVLILDKQLNILKEKIIEKEVEALSFGTCRSTVDSHGNVIVATTVQQRYNAYTTTDHGVFYKFDNNGNLISHRYLIEDYPDPIYYLFNFHLRQMWYKDNETLLCLALASGGVMSFITFDSAFNYIEEHPIVRDRELRSDQVLYDDAYTDHWYNEEEALFFSSRGDYEHNDLRLSRINTQGEFLDYIHLTDTPDTIYYTAQHRNMATVNDSVIYYCYDYHTIPLYPGIGGVFMFNDKLEIIGHYLFDDCMNYRSAIILPTADDGCIVVNHYSPYTALEFYGVPIITKLNKSDFTTLPLATSQQTETATNAYPNPTYSVLNIPLFLDVPQVRCQVIDTRGLVLTDRIINVGNDCRPLLQLDVTSLKQGLYYYRIYTAEKTLLTEKFIKK